MTGQASGLTHWHSRGITLRALRADRAFAGSSQSCYPVRASCPGLTGLTVMVCPPVDLAVSLRHKDRRDSPGRAAMIPPQADPLRPCTIPFGDEGARTDKPVVAPSLFRVCHTAQEASFVSLPPCEARALPCAQTLLTSPVNQKAGQTLDNIPACWHNLAHEQAT